MKRAYFVSLFLCLTPSLLSQSSPIGASQADAKAQARILDGYGKLPLSFETNQGQTDGRVKFLSRTGGYTLFLTGDEAVLALSGSKPETNKAKIAGMIDKLLSNMDAPKAGGVLRMKLRNANPAAKVTGLDELAGTSNYFIGNDPAKWRSHVPTYAKVKYEGIYSGIDLVYYGNQRQLEYDFVVAPGANPRRIAFDVRGAKRIRRDQHGDLVVRMSEGEIRWHKPVVYQEKDGARQLIAAHYAITDTNRVGFEVAGYDASRPLYIDPLIYSTYLGGSQQDFGYGIALDSAGNAYVTGFTSSANFPTENPLQPTYGGDEDAFVTEINPSGSALVYSTYLGGSNIDIGLGIAVDSAGNAYVTGLTESTNFPTMNPLQPANKGDAYTAFVAEIDATGSALVYSTYLGGSGAEVGYSIAVDSSANAYVTGETLSNDFPVTPGAFQTTCISCRNGNNDAFVAKLNPSGSALVYSTYLGGSGGNEGHGIAVDSAGNAYVTGWTQSTNFPTMNPLQPAYGGSTDAFVAEINPTGSALVYSTYLGGSGIDYGTSIAVDSAGNAYVIGYTGSTDFPTMNPLQPTFGGGVYDAFVAKLNPTGSALAYSTYLGGSSVEFGYGIAVDSVGNAYVTGYTGSSDFPTMSPLQPNAGGGGDAFVTEINPSGSALVYSTYLGGSGSDSGNGIAVDSAGSAYVTGQTYSSDFPVTPGAFQTTCNVGNYCSALGDAFVSRIAKSSAVVKLTPPSLNFGNQAVGTTSTPQVSRLTNTGSATLTITSISVTGANGGDFAETNNCGTSVPAGGSCNISVTFTPTALGTRTGRVTITDNANDSPQTISLTGIGGVAIGSVSPTSLAFGAQLVNTTSAPKPVALFNTGDAQLTVISFGVTGDFAIQTNYCTNGVRPGTHCDVYVTFSPTQPGARSGKLTFVDNATNSPQAVSLTGVGTSTTTTTLTSVPNPSALGQAVTLTAVVIPTFNGTPTGTVTFYDGTTSLGTVVLNLGAAKLVKSTLVAGTHSLTGSYSGDAVFQPSTSPVVTQVVKQGLATVTLGSSPNPSYVNQTVVFTATVGGVKGIIPTGSVNFKQGAVVLSTVPLVNGNALYSTAFGSSGTKSITAVYSGDPNYLGKTSKVLKQEVNKYTSNTSAASSLNPSVYGQAVNLTSQVTSGAPSQPTGTVTFKNGLSSLGTVPLVNGFALLTKKNLPVGTLSITATYNGDTLNNKSTSPTLSQVVSQATTTTTVTSSPNPSVLGQNVTFKATVKSPTVVPVGTVTFTAGTTTLGTVSLAGGKASLTTSALPAGKTTVTATYNGTSNITGSSGSVVQTVN